MVRWQSAVWAGEITSSPAQLSNCQVPLFHGQSGSLMAARKLPERCSCPQSGGYPIHAPWVPRKPVPAWADIRQPGVGLFVGRQPDFSLGGLVDMAGDPFQQEVLALAGAVVKTTSHQGIVHHFVTLQAVDQYPHELTVEACLQHPGTVTLYGFFFLGIR